MRFECTLRLLVSTFLIINALLKGDSSETMAQYDCFQAEQNLALRGNQSSLVGGVVSPSSGQICAERVDMQVQAAQPLALKRRYLAPYVLQNYLQPDGMTSNYDFLVGRRGPSAASKRNVHDQEHYLFYKHMESTYQGWVYFPQQHLTYTSDGFCTFTDHFGATIRFCKDASGSFVVSSDSSGFCNAQGEEASARYDLRNTSLTLSPDNSTAIVRAPDGNLAGLWSIAMPTERLHGPNTDKIKGTLSATALAKP